MAFELRILSPSQVQKTDCVKAWGLRYLAKLETPPSPAAEDGKQIAKRLEDYYKTGIMPVPDFHGRVALAALTELPKYNRAAVKPEAPLYEVPYAGALFGSRREGRESRMDVCSLSREDGFRIGPEDDPWPLDAPLLCDLKTVSNFDFVKTEEDLKKDIQATLYAKAIMLTTGAKVVQCRWLYVTREKTKRPRTKPVDFLVTADDVAAAEELWRERVSWVVKLYCIRPDPHQLPMNLRACKKYRGCEFWHTGINACMQSNPERMIAAMSTAPTNNDALRAEVNDFLDEVAPEGMPAPVTAAPKSFTPPGGTKMFSTKPKYTAATFPLPNDEDGNPIPESMRAEFLRWCAESQYNPLDHLNVQPDAAFMADCIALVAKAAQPVVAPPPAQPAAPALSKSQPVTPVVLTQSQTVPPGVIAAAQAPAEPPKPRGRPPDSEEVKAAKAAAKAAKAGKANGSAEDTGEGPAAPTTSTGAASAPGSVTINITLNVSADAVDRIVDVLSRLA
jgi:hypothetical protein